METPRPALTTEQMIQSFVDERTRQQKELFTKMFSLPPTEVIIDKGIDK